MKAIAMKMTQEQFESVKDELKGFAGFRNLYDFENDPYFVTNHYGSLGILSCVVPVSKDTYNRTVYEHFDKDILFDALDIKPKQTDLDKKIADVIEFAKGLGLNVKVIFE